MKPRKEIFQELFPSVPSYRWRQAEYALFLPKLNSWEEVTTLPKEMRKLMEERIPWISYKDVEVFSSKELDSYKARLKLLDGEEIETVLMRNARGDWTVCLSTQVGCALGCLFCATGSMGYSRDLIADEMIDQYRFWNRFILEKDLGERISNLVFMGMGEPFLNYENLKEAIKSFLTHTDLGKNRITVSTIGILPKLKEMLYDPDWPGVRLAISIQSADYKTRKMLIPSTTDDFFSELVSWAKLYLRKYKSRRHFLTFENVMLKGINDNIYQAKLLSKLIKEIDKTRIKVNLIPYNQTNANFERSDEKSIKRFKEYLEEHGITCTIRESKGQDIWAACGQLIIEKK